MAHEVNITVVANLLSKATDLAEKLETLEEERIVTRRDLDEILNLVRTALGTLP